MKTKTRRNEEDRAIAFWLQTAKRMGIKTSADAIRVVLRTKDIRMA